MAMTVGELVAYLDIEDKEYHRKLDVDERRASTFGSKVSGAFSSIGRVGLLAAAGGVAAMGAGLAAGVVAGIKYNSTIEQTTIAMGTMLGSTAKAKALIGDVANMAAATPFQFPELADSTKKLVAYGIAQKEVIPTMTRLGDVSSALNIPIGELSDLYGKAKVQGKIMMQDMYQFSGRGIPIFQALAKSMGVPVSKIKELVSAGKVGFPDIEKAFVGMTGKGSMFGGMMEKQSHSFSGLWSTIVDGVTKAFGDALMPAFEWMTKKGMPALVEGMPRIQSAVKTTFGVISGGLKALIGAFSFIVRNFELIKTILIPLTAAFIAYKIAMIAVKIPMAVAAAQQWLLNAAMSANPIGLVVIAIAALVGGFTLLWMKCGWFRNFWIAVWSVVKAEFALVWPVIKVVGEKIVAVLQWTWDKVSAAVKWFWGWAGPFIKVEVRLWWTVVKAVMGFIVGGIKDAWHVVSVLVKAFWHWAGPFIRTNAAVWWSVIKSAMNTISSVMRVAWPIIVGIVKTSINAIKTAVRVVRDIIGIIGAVWTRVHNAADAAWSKIVGIVKGAFDRIKGFANSIIGVINWVIEKVPGLSSVANVPTFGGTGKTTSSASSTSSGGRVSTPAIMDNGGMGGPVDAIGSGIGGALGSAAGWVGDLLSKFNIFDKLPEPTGGLFGGATNALLDMGKDAIVGLLKKFGLGDRQKIVDFAMSMLGVPYAWGGTSPAGFDCSGLLYWAYKQAGQDIPRIPTNGGRQINRGDIQPADIMFYYPGSIQEGVRVPFGHFKMYAGNNETVESTSGGVQRRPADWGGAAQIRSYLANGGITRGLAIVGENNKEEAVLPLTDERAMSKLRDGLGRGESSGDTRVAVFLDSEQIATHVEVRREQRKRRGGRLR